MKIGNLIAVRKGKVRKLTYIVLVTFRCDLSKRFSNLVKTFWIIEKILMSSSDLLYS